VSVLRRQAWVRLALVLACQPLPWASADIHIEDDRHQEVRLPHAAQRAVSLAPFLTELVYSVEAGERLVGVSDYSDYPEAARRLRRVASAAAVDYESIAALKPDIVLVWLSGNGPAVTARLQQLGFTVFGSEPRRVGDIARNLAAVARIFGTEARVAPKIKRFENEMEQLRGRYGGGVKPVSIFYQIAQRPLMTLSGKHIVSDALALCGGRNIFAGAIPLAPTVNQESVIHHDPEVVLINTSIKDADALRQQWLNMHSIRAGRRGNVYTVDASLVTRPTLRFARGVEQLCALIDRARR